MKKPSFMLELISAPRPVNRARMIRNQLRKLGPPPACLKFAGCKRQLYAAAIQVGARIEARKQPDGTYLVWKKPTPVTASVSQTAIKTV